LTLIELIVALSIIGIVAAIAIPSVKRGMNTESIRGARRLVTSHLAMARGTAANRGCRTELHMTSGASARIWITSCTMTGTGIDTIGQVQNLNDRFGVTVSTSANTVVFAPNGLGASADWITVKFGKAGYSDSLGISPIGWPAW
jgi:type IV fimbrial biogenesis protein FimT